MSVRQQKRSVSRGGGGARRRTAAVVAVSGVGGLLVAGLTPGAAAKVGQEVVPAPEMVRDLTPGSGSTEVGALEVWGESVVFVSEAGSDGELWQVPSGEGPRRLLESTLTGKSVGDVEVVDDRLFFTAREVDSFDSELWVSDGTDAGTEVVIEASEDVKLGSLSAVGGTLFFHRFEGDREDGDYSYGLWKTDGTLEGTGLVKPGLTAQSMAEFGDLAVITPERDGNDFYHLWVSDGTSDGTVRLTTEGFYGSPPPEYAVVGDTLFFMGSYEGDVLKKSDGTVSGTEVVKKIPGKGRYMDMQNFNAIGETLVFSTRASGESVMRWWRSDGTAKGTKQIASFDSLKRNQYARSVVMNGRVYFTQELAGTTQLWSTNGTKKGTRQVSNFGKSGGVAAGYYGRMAAAGDRVWFTASTKTTGRELWSSDGSARGTTLAVDIVPGRKDSVVERLTAVGDVVYFTADDGTHGRELWRSVEPVGGAVLKASAKQKQPKKVSKKVKLAVKVKAGESATVTLRGNAKVKGHKSFKVKKKAVKLQRGVVDKVTLRLGKGNKPVLKAVKKWRKGKGKPVWATVTATFKADGAKSIRKLKIKLT